MATLQKVFQTLIPDAIGQGNYCYQEHLRGTSNQDLYIPIAARIGAFVPKALTPYVQQKVYDNQLVVGIALTVLFNMGLSYYGASRGYNLNFRKELMVLTFSPVVSQVIEAQTKPERGRRTDNQKRVAFLLHTLVAVATSCTLYKFQSERNSLPLRPYLYWTVGAILVGQLKAYNFDQQINTALGGTIPYPQLVNQLASRILIGFCMAQAAKLGTGQQIQVAWRWEILSSGAIFAARAFL